MRRDLLWRIIILLSVPRALGFESRVSLVFVQRREEEMARRTLVMLVLLVALVAIAQAGIAMDSVRIAKFSLAELKPKTSPGHAQNDAQIRASSAGVAICTPRTGSAGRTVP